MWLTVGACRIYVGQVELGLGWEWKLQKNEYTVQVVIKPDEVFGVTTIRHL